MSEGFGDVFDIVGRYFLEADPASAQKAMTEIGKIVAREMGRIEERTGRLRRSKAGAEAKRYAKFQIEVQEKLFRDLFKMATRQFDRMARAEAEAQRRSNERARIRQENEWKRRENDQKSHLRQVERHQAEHEKRVTRTHDRAERDRTIATEEQSRIRVAAENEAQKRATDDRRAYNKRAVDQAATVQTQIRNAINAGYKQRDRDAQTAASRQRARDNSNAQIATARIKEAEKRGTAAHTAGLKARQKADDSANRRAENEQKATLAEQQRATDAAERRSLASFNAAERRRLFEQRRAASVQLQAKRHADRLTEQADRASHQRRVAVFKQFLSVLRTTNETAQRALVRAGQSHFRRLHEDRRHAQRLELQETQTHQRRVFSLFNRHSTRIQQINRQTVRQQGVVGAGQAVATQGILGSIFSLRNIALSGGAFFSARAIFGTVADYQQTQIAFEGLLGSAERAEDLLGDIRQFAEETPFQFQGLAQASRQLLGIGFAAEEVIPALSDIGGAAAVLGASESDIQGVIRALGQMAGQGKATAEDVNQISERLVGFNVRAAIAEHLGVTTGEAMDLMASGAISADVAIEGILAGMREFPGASEALGRQSKTLTGRLSTLKDVVNNLIIDALSPLAPAVGEAIGRFTELAQSLFRGSGSWEIVRSGLLGIAAAAGVLLSLQLAQYFGAVVAAINPLAVAFFALGAGAAILMRHFPDVREEFFALAEIVRQFAVDKLQIIGDFFVGLLPIVEKLGGAVGDAFMNLFSGGGFGDFVDSISAVFAEVGRVATTLAEPIVAFFQSAFARAQEWLKTGGAEAIVGGFLDMLETVVVTVRQAGAEILERGLWKPLLAGAAVFFATNVLGIGLGPIILAAIGASLVASAPEARERIGNFFSDVMDNVGDFLTERLPKLFLGALTAAGFFLGGPVVSTILSEAGQKIILGLAAGAVAGAGAFLLGFVEGLRESLPRAADTLQQIFDDLIAAAADAIAATGPFGVILDAIAVPLQGILPALELFVEVMSLIPSPVILAGAALGLLAKHLVTVHKAFKETGKTGGIVTFINWLQTLPGKTMVSGGALRDFGRQMEFTNRAAQNVGPLTISQRAYGNLGTSVAAAGTAVRGIGAALPAIGTAAAIGIPIALGLFEAARARAEKWNAEVKALRDQFTDGGKDVREFISEDALRNMEGFADALNEAGLSVQTVANAAASRDVANIGELFTQISPAIGQRLDELGISMEEFSRAAAEGDRAVGDLGMAFGDISPAQVGSLKDLFQDIPEPIRQVIDLSQEAAESFLDQQFAAGALTDEQVQLYASLKSGAEVQETYGSLAGQVSGEIEHQSEVLNENREVVDGLTGRLEAATNESQSFAEAIDKITGSAIEVGQSRENVEGTFDAITEGIREGQTLGELSSNFLSAADSIINVFQTLSDANRPREAVRQYQQLRQRLIEQYEQLGLNERQATEFTDALIPPVGEIRREMGRARQAIVDELRQQRRNLRQALREGTLTGQGAQAARELIGDIEAAIAAEGEIPVPLRPEVDNAGWDAVAEGMRREWLRTHPEFSLPVAVEVTAPAGSAQEGRLGILGGARGFTGGGGPGGGGGGPGRGGAFEDIVAPWRNTADQIALILFGLLGRFEDFQAASTKIFADTGNSIVRDITKSMNQMVDVGKRAATAFVSIVTFKLRQGATQVGLIVAGYVGQLVKAINPLLQAIGENRLEVGGGGGGNMFGFAQGGITPNIAEGGTGPVVHVYNEGRGGKGSAHGEAFIPFDPSMRARSRAIAEETVRRLGGRTTFFAQGGITQPVPNVSGDWQGLNPVFAQRLSAWASALGDNFHINSGFRSYDEQVAAYNRYLAGQGAQAAVPGTSLHEFGLAADGPHWSGRGPGGFQLTYPMSFEPWHVQPVEGRALGDAMILPPLPKPPDAGDRGWLSQVGAAVMDFIYKKALSWAGSVGMSAPGLSAVSGGTPAIMAELLKQASARGWGSGAQWAALTNLIREESSFNPNAQNPNSTAYGLFQFLDDTWAGTGIAKTANFILQIVAGLRYIAARYVDPIKAWAFWQRNHYYANGGIVSQPTMAMIGEAGPEVVLPLNRPTRLRQLLSESGIAGPLLDALIGDRPDLERAATSNRGRSGRPIDLNLNINVEGGDVDPVLYTELASAVRSGVSDGMARAEAIEGRW